MKFPDLGDKQSQSNSKAGLFVRLKDGERIRGIFMGDPRIFHQHWIDKKPFPCSGKETCDLCKKGEKSQFRFRLNFLVKEEGVLVAKIFEGSYGVLLDLRNLHEGDYNLEETLVEVSRSGELQQTRYTILPVKNNGGLKPEHFDKYKKIPLNDLKSPGESSEEQREPGDESLQF